MKRLLISPILAALLILTLAGLAIAQECITYWAYSVDSWVVAAEDESSPPTSLSYSEDEVQATFSIVYPTTSAYIEIPVYPSLITQTVTITQEIYRVCQSDGFNWHTPVDFFARFVHQSGSFDDHLLLLFSTPPCFAWVETSASETSTPDDPITRLLIKMTKNEYGYLRENNPWQAIFRNTEISYSVCGYAPGALSCSTIPNAHFSTDATWTLYGTAVITNSTLTLENGDVALQNISGLTPNRTYNAVISVTDVISGPIELNVSLGDVARVFEISSPGYYTDTLITPAYVGAYQYALWNQTDEGSIDLGYTCLSLASTGAGGSEQYECLAPTNGEFDTASDWEYLRGAEWENPAQRAGLPDADKGLIRSTDTYELPTLGSGEYLLMGFDSASTEDAGGGVSARVADDSSEVVYNFSNYITPYRFEMDISSLAGLTETTVALVNPGDALTGTNSSNIWVDNVCIFIADRPLQLPVPLDPDTIIPVDLGFNYGSCADVDSIFAYFGVNIQQYRAEYEAGASVWDPIGWVPWLISAFWVILATYACFFMGAFVTLVNILEYIINNGLNIWSWVERMWGGTIDWGDLWLWWSGLSLTNLSDAYGQFLADWATWIGNALVLYSGKIGVTLAAASDWIGQSLTNISNWFGENLSNLYLWLDTYLFNANGLRTLLNLLIAAWNLFLLYLGVDLSAILDDTAWLWNNGLGPALQTILSLLWALSPLQLPYTIIQLIFSLLGLIWSIAVYIWTDGLSVAHTPLTFYNAFDASLNSAPYDPLAGCVSDNFWCVFLAGIQIINQTASHSIFYPIIITGIILSTIVILWQNLVELFHIEISTTGFK